MAVKATPAGSRSRTWMRLSSRPLGTKYAAGVNAVTVAPGQLAAAQKALWLQNIQASQNIWALKVASVDLATWKQQTSTIGAQNLATGAQKGAPKMATFARATSCRNCRASSGASRHAGRSIRI